MTTCAIQGCERPIKAKGWCSIHWQRWWKHGDPLKRLRKANGEGWTSSVGYLMVTVDGEEKLVHVLVAEKALGRPLPKGSQVHHADENPLNNEPANLVICPSNAYHKLLHQRMRALAACGHAGWRKCQFCQEYDDPDGMKKRASGVFCHVECERADARVRHARKREERNVGHLS